MKLVWPGHWLRLPQMTCRADDLGARGLLAFNGGQLRQPILIQIGHHLQMQTCIVLASRHDIITNFSAISAEIIDVVTIGTVDLLTTCHKVGHETPNLRRVEASQDLDILWLGILGDICLHRRDRFRLDIVAGS